LIISTEVAQQKTPTNNSKIEAIGKEPRFNSTGPDAGRCARDEQTPNQWYPQNNGQGHSCPCIVDN
jgi:hypothetical protein